MKFTITFEIETSEGLTPLVSDPQFDFQNREEIDYLKKILYEQAANIVELENKLDQVLTRVTVREHEPENKPEPQKTDPDPDHPANEKKVRECFMCGKPVPAHKKRPFCSTRCYNRNYAKTHESKKVKEPQAKPD